MGNDKLKENNCTREVIYECQHLSWNCKHFRSVPNQDHKCMWSKNVNAFYERCICKKANQEAEESLEHKQADRIKHLESRLENQYEIERDLRKRIDYLSL